MSYFTHLDKFSDQTALIDEFGKRVSYADLLSEGDRFAALIGRRCLVFIFCANHIEPVSAYLGCLRANIVPVLLSQTLDESLVLRLIEDYRPAFLFLPETRRSGNLDGHCAGQMGSYTLVETGFEEDYALHQDLALLLTTSGSTGSPKLVRQSYTNIESNTDSIVEYLGAVPADRAISTLPMHYTYGLSILNTHLSIGASVVLTEAPVTSRVFWELLKNEQVTNFGGVPYVYEMLKKLRFERMDLPHLRYLTQAGGHLASSLLLEFCETCEQKGIRFIVMYGQTEATARMAWLPWEYTRSKSESIGIAIPGGKFWLAAEDLSPISEPDTVGELVYDGPNVTMGYAESRHDLSKNDEFGGQLFTGDMAKRDSDNFYYIVGRKKRFLKLFGSRVNLDEIEGLLNEAGWHCACTGKDDRLLVYLENEAHVEPVEKYLGERLTLNRAGFKVTTIKSIPRSEAGKVLYSALS